MSQLNTDIFPDEHSYHQELLECVRKWLINYIQTLENQSINLVFDRTFFTEENYCRQGFKEYSFTEVYNKLLEKFSKLDFEIYYISR